MAQMPIPATPQPNPPIRPPDVLLAAALARGHGSVLSAELADCGIDSVGVRRLVGSGELLRVRRGVFVDGHRHQSATPALRHALAACAVLRASEGRLAAAHLTAAALWGLPVVASDLGHIEVCRIGSGQRRLRPPVLVHGGIDATDVVHLRGLPVTKAHLVVAQLLVSRGSRAAIIAADGALASGVLARADLLAHADQHGSAALRVLARLASGSSESPGESWAKLVLHGLGYAAEQQVELHTPTGEFVGRVDFLIRELRLVIEFDGRGKYDGADGSTLYAEKRREDGIRALGYRVVRLVWADLADPRIVARKLAGALAA